MMDEKLFVRDNDLVRRNCEKLYLDSRTSDVCFVFTATGTDQYETVLAHKILLSAISPVFDAMFFGSLIEEGDIEIVDASAQAFREFLQFFYLNQVRLTSEHIGEVINLCNKYELPEALKMCEIPLLNSLTSNDICWGYEIAILLELEHLQRFCEQKITENPQDILLSDTFLLCHRKSVDKILQLIETGSHAQVTIDACMDWAKADCQRNNLEMNAKNYRIRLGDLFKYLLQSFVKISVQQFFDFNKQFHDILSADEINSIKRMILTRILQSSKFADFPLSILPRIECDRRTTNESEVNDMQFGFGCFEANKTLLLREFYLPKLPSKLNLGSVHTMEVICAVYGPFDCYRGELQFFERVTLTSERETCVVLTEPIIVEGGKGYSMSLTKSNYDSVRGAFYEQGKELKLNIQFGDGLEISFYPGSTLLSRLIFLQPTTLG